VVFAIHNDLDADQGSTTRIRYASPDISTSRQGYDNIAQRLACLERDLMKGAVETNGACTDTVTRALFWDVLK
jgi:hypothetical protein